MLQCNTGFFFLCPSSLWSLCDFQWLQSSFVIHQKHCSVAFSALFCGWTLVTCEDLARKSSAPTRCALPVKPTLLGWLSSPIVHHRTVCFKWTTLSFDFVKLWMLWILICWRTKDHLLLHLTHCSFAFSALFCGWTLVTCEDLARKSSAPTRCALPVKPRLLGRSSSPIVHHRIICFKWTNLSIVDFV
jgi:hypothetical protein